MTAQSVSAVGPRKRILLVTNTGWGMFRFREGLVRKLAAEGWDVFALADWRDGYEDEVRALGAQTLHLPVRGASIDPIGDAAYLARLYRHYVRLRPDVVQHYTIKPVIYGSLAAKAAGVTRIVNNVTGLGSVFSGGRPVLKSVLAPLYRAALSGRPLTIFQNPDDREVMERAGIATPARSLTLLGSGVDTLSLLPDETLLHSERNDVVMACRLLWDKGVREFVECARAVRALRPDTRFVLYGGAAADYGSKNAGFVDPAFLEAAMAEGVIVWHGRQPGAAVEAAFRKAALVVLPSYYPEGVPRSLIEAASLGVPIVTTDMPGCREVVEDGVSGRLCRARSADDLTQAVLELLQDPDRRSAMGKAGRARAVAKFDEAVILSRLLSVYKEGSTCTGAASG